MKTKSITRVLALILVLATLFTTAAGAASIGTDYPGGYVNVMIRQSEINNYLNITYSGYSPVALSGRTWSYITADGKLTGAAYCIDHGGYYPSGYITVSTKPYTASPALCGAVACGFPQTTLAAFTAAHSDTAGMTESKFSYATQLAVWAALNQIGVAGTAFTSGLGMVEEPTDAAQLRVFRAVQGILSDAQSYTGGTAGGGISVTGDSSSAIVNLGTETSLVSAADSNAMGIARETIGGVEYLTRAYTVAGAQGAVSLWDEGAPSGTVFAANSAVLPTAAENGQTVHQLTGTAFKLCVPADATEASSTGKITIHASGLSGEAVTVYMAYNTVATEQSFAIVDRGTGAAASVAYLLWGEAAAEEPDEPDIPDIPDTPEQTFTIRKLDAQNGYPKAGAVFRLEQIDGHFSTEAATQADGVIQFTVDDLPYGSYRVTELRAPSGYEVDTTIRTAEWNGTADVELVFSDVRKLGFSILKTDVTGKLPLAHAVFDVYKNGELVTTVETNDAGIASVAGLGTGYYEVVETAAPEGYILDGTRHGVYLDPYDPATANDPVFILKNDAKPDLQIVKTDAITGEPIAGVTFVVNKADSSTLTTVVTGPDGTALLEALEPGVYQVREQSVPDGYLLDETPQLMTLEANKTGTVRFQNYPKPDLTINKVDSITGDPVVGAKFSIVYASNNTFTGEINDLGFFYTDEAGYIELTDLQDGWYKATEVEAPKGYAIKEPAAQEFFLEAGRGKTVTFENVPLSALIIRKVDADSGDMLQGAKFRLRYLGGTSGTGGTVIGEYVTSINGTIVITGLKAGTYIVEETKAPDGYDIDDTPQTVYISGREQDVITVEFTNGKHGGLIIRKIDSDTKKPLPGAEFLVTTADGTYVANYGGKVSSNGIYVTDAYGEIRLVDLKPGTYVVTETKAPAGYIMDSTPQTVVVNTNDTQTLTFVNKAACSILIHKTDAATGKGIYGVTFILYDSGRSPVGQYTTDQNGYAYIDKELTSGQYYLREFDAPDGYIPDTQYKTVYVEAGRTTTIEWQNTAVTGQIQITKYASESSSVTGAAEGTTLKGAVFEIVRYKSGVVVGHITTDARGVAASEPLPLGRYIVREVRAPAYYQLSSQTFDVELEFAGQIIRLAAFDKPAELGVSITKTGIKEVLAGSRMYYSIKAANTSNVALDSFFWHDRIPTDACAAISLTTGTYSQRLTYRVLYKTNYCDYRVLASNLLTTNNYSFALSALPLMSGEAVTDVYFDFGAVPSGFQSKTSATLGVIVGPKVAEGYSIINRADVGGKYLNTWELNNASWLTIARNLTPTPILPLPKTGY